MSRLASRFSSENGVSPLENGDRLTRAEFERRFEAMPQVKKAELIEGIVYIPSPPRFFQHGQPNAHVVGWLGTYEASTLGMLVADSTTVRLDLDNEVQPDALFLIDPAHGGQVRLSADEYIEGAPELVAEVAASSVSIDLNTKLHVYRRNGVREYIVWRVLDRQIDWFVLRNEQYQRQEPDGQGLLRSEVFPGLWLDPAALVRGDMVRVLSVLQKGLASPEHRTFVARLQQ